MLKEPFVQQGDPILYQTLNGGDLTIVDGFLQMSGGLPTAVYLSLFGGNFEDDGRANNPGSWWGNALESDSVGEYHSETQYLMESLPAIPANLRRIEDAVIRDLQWLIDQKIANIITAVASMPALNRIHVAIVVQADGDENRFEFVECWRAGGFEPILEPLEPEWRVLENFYPRLTSTGEPRILEP